MYAWSYLGGNPNLQAAQIVSDIVAALAGITILVSLALYFWTPKSHITPLMLTIYTLLTITVAWLLYETGGLSSPFIVLWMLIAVFSGIFGLIGLGSLFAIIVAYTVWQFSLGEFTSEDVPALLLTGFLPLAISIIVWKDRDENSNRRTNITAPLNSELNKVTNQSEIVINAIGDGVLAIDGQSIVRLINPAAQNIIGWDQRDAVKLNYKSVLQMTNEKGEELTINNDPIAISLNTNQEIRDNSLSLITNSGKKLSISVTVSPIGDPGAGVIVTFRDITKERAEERQQAEFISTASHEMRTPVASIEGYLGLVLNPATATIDDKARAYVMKAHESVQHLGRLFQDLLDITKAEDGRLSSKPKPTDMVEFMREIVDSFRPKAQEKGLELKFQPSAVESKIKERQLNPVYYVNSDNDHLREVFGNLVENAIKYTPQGTVTIDITGDDDSVEVRIADSGIGIPAEDIPHLFQKFYRVDSTDTREIGGTGLGLYLSRRLVESMNGRLWVESTYKKGSTFFVSIPRLSNTDATRLIEEMTEVESTKNQTESSNTVPIASNQTAIQQPDLYTTQEPATIQAPQPQYQTPTPQTEPVQPEPPQPQAPQTSGPIQRQHTNIPLSSIEQNPRQYSYYSSRAQSRPPVRPPTDSQRPT